MLSYHVIFLILRNIIYILSTLTMQVVKIVLLCH